MKLRRRQRPYLCALAFVLPFILFACGGEPPVEPEPEPEPVWPQFPGYEAMQIPADNPMTVAKVNSGNSFTMTPDSAETESVPAMDATSRNMASRMASHLQSAPSTVP